MISGCATRLLEWGRFVLIERLVCHACVTLFGLVPTAIPPEVALFG
jgi:hypothetical protein